MPAPSAPARAPSSRSIRTRASASSCSATPSPPACRKASPTVSSTSSSTARSRRTGWRAGTRSSTSLFGPAIAAARATYAAPPDPATPALPHAAYLGTYANAYAGEAVVAAEGGGLVLRLGPEGKTVFPLTHFDRDIFLYVADAEMPDVPSSLRFAIGPDGRAASADSAIARQQRPRDPHADGLTPGEPTPANALREIAVAGEAPLVGEAEPLRAARRLGVERRGRRSGRDRRALVVAEEHVAQLRVAVEAHRAPDEGVELPHQEIGQVEGAHLGVAARGEARVAVEEAVAVRPRDHLDPERGAARREQPAGAAVGIGDEDRARSGRAPPSTAASTASGMRSGQRCSLAGRHCRSRCSQPFSAFSARISRASAPQAMMSTEPRVRRPAAQGPDRGGWLSSRCIGP